jgi:peptide/nickel transport system permease protein
MRRFILRRLLFFMFTLFLTSVLVFALTRILPGDVARVLLGREASAEQVAAARAELGLDEPLIIQYGQWLLDLTTGNWGTTFTQPRQPIRQVILPRLGKSMRLAGLTLLIAVPVSIALGVITALFEGRWLDVAISTLMLSAASLPEFVTGLFLINVVALRWACCVEAPLAA